MTFGEQIKQKREALGLTQEELAEKLDVSRQAISKWESDLSMPAGKNKSALCHLLGIEDEKQAVSRTMLRWLYGGWLAAAVCAVALAVILIAGTNHAGADASISNEDLSKETTPAITGLHFVDANCKYVEDEANWYPAAGIRGVLITYTGPSPNAVKLFATPTGTEMTAYTELWLTQDILTHEGFILLPLNLSEKTGDGLMVHFYAELQFDDQTTITSDSFNLYAE